MNSKITHYPAAAPSGGNSSNSGGGIISMTQQQQQNSYNYIQSSNNNSHSQTRGVTHSGQQQQQYSSGGPGINQPLLGYGQGNGSASQQHHSHHNNYQEMQQHSQRDSSLSKKYLVNEGGQGTYPPSQQAVRETSQNRILYQNPQSGYPQQQQMRPVISNSGSGVSSQNQMREGSQNRALGGASANASAGMMKIGTSVNQLMMQPGSANVIVGSNVSTPAGGISQSSQHVTRPSMTQKPPTADMRSYHHNNNPSASSLTSNAQQHQHQMMYQKNLKYLVDSNQKNALNIEEGSARQPSSANVPRRDANGGGVAGYRSTSNQSHGQNNTRSSNQSSERPSVNPQSSAVNGQRGTSQHHKSLNEQSTASTPYTNHNQNTQNTNSAASQKSRNPSSGSQNPQQQVVVPQFNTVLSDNAGNTTQMGSARGNSANAEQRMMMANNLPRSTTNKTYSSLTSTQIPLNGAQASNSEFMGGNLSGRGVLPSTNYTSSQLPPFMRSGGINTQPPTQPRQSVHNSTITTGSSATSSNLTSQASSSNVSTLKNTFENVISNNSISTGLSSKPSAQTSQKPSGMLVTKQASSQSVNNNNSQTRQPNNSSQQQTATLANQPPFMYRNSKVIQDDKGSARNQSNNGGNKISGNSSASAQQVQQVPQGRGSARNESKHAPSSQETNRSRPQSGTREQSVTLSNVVTNSRTQSASNALQFKSQTHNPATLHQLIKDANTPQQTASTVPPKQITQQAPLHHHQPISTASTRLKSASRAEPQSSGTQLLPSRNQNPGGGLFQHHSHKSQQNSTIAGNSSNSKLNLKAFFEQNQENISVTSKLDPQTGTQTKIQSFTTLNINEMFHENASIEGDESEDTRKLPLQPGTRIVVPNHEPTKCSLRRNGIVRAYAANTNQGLVRGYNEDRVSIILNIVKPEHRQHEQWPKCSFFGVYDGHGGHLCAEFLRDNLHHFVVREDSFPWNPEMALARGFQKAEDKFMNEICYKVGPNGEQSLVERSGSCAIVVLIVGETCYVANVGDSRAVMSSNGGTIVQPLSQDHKPCDPDEYQRIVAGGGQVYQTTTATSSQSSTKDVSSPRNPPANPNKEVDNGENTDYIVGPIRVLPGRLSVSRTFGDPEAKFEFRGGNPNVVVCKPDIQSFKITKDHDFIILGCDGIFDKLSNEDVSFCVWNSVTMDNKDQKLAQNVHQQSGLAVESILKNSLYRQSLDNVTVVMIAFQNFKRQVFGKSKHSSSDRSPLKSSSHHQNSQGVAATTSISTKHEESGRQSNFTPVGNEAKENNSHQSNGVGTNKPNLSPFVSLRGTSKSINGNGQNNNSSQSYQTTMKSPLSNQINGGGGGGGSIIQNDENVPPSASSQQKNVLGGIGGGGGQQLPFGNTSSSKQFSSTMNSSSNTQNNSGNLNKPPTSTSNFYNGLLNNNGKQSQPYQVGSSSIRQNGVEEHHQHQHPLKEKTNLFLNRPSSSSQNQLFGSGPHNSLNGSSSGLGVRKPSLTKQAPPSLLSQEFGGVNHAPGTSTNQQSSSQSMIFRSMQNNINSSSSTLTASRPITAVNQLGGSASSINTNGHHFKSTSATQQQNQV